MAAAAKTIVDNEEIIQYLHPNLLFLDYEKYTVKLIIILASFTLFCTLVLVSWVMTSRMSKVIGLGVKEQVFCNLAIVRALYGTVATLVGMWATFNQTNYNRDIVFGQTATGSFALNATVGFFIFECVSLIASDVAFGSFTRLLHVHHLFCTATGAVILFSEAGYSLAVMSLTLEMSTPFSAICWILLKSGKGRTKLWFINQAILIHTFHMRSVFECYEWWLTYNEWTVLWANTPGLPFIMGYTSLAIFTFIATPYWCYKKTMQMAFPMDWNFESVALDHAQNGHVAKLD